MNILNIFADQHHKYALGAVDARYRTPALDRLAAQGVRFVNAYTPNPMCGPFRGCLMTGRLASRNGLIRNNMPLPANEPALAELLGGAGWQTGFVGKWHLGGQGAGPIPQALRGGFQRFCGYQCYNGFDPAPPYANRVAFFDEADQERVYGVHREEVTTCLAVDMLRDFARVKRPFCLMVGYQAPHYPLQPSPRFEAMYRDAAFPAEADDEPFEPYTPTFNPPSPKPWENDPDWRRYGGNPQAYRRLYAAMVSQVDDGVGRILAELDALGLAEDTLVIYTADHGDMQGSHGLVNKGVPYEKSAGVPMIIRCPGGRKGQVSDLLISGMDIFAAAMEAAGLDQPRDGHSFLPYVSGRSDVPFNAYIVSESLRGDAPWRMIRTPAYKLTVSWPEATPTLLFDMARDPNEMHNLVNQPGSEQIIARLLPALNATLC